MQRCLALLARHMRALLPVVVSRAARCSRLHRTVMVDRRTARSKECPTCRARITAQTQEEAFELLDAEAVQRDFANEVSGRLLALFRACPDLPSDRAAWRQLPLDPYVPSADECFAFPAPTAVASVRETPLGASVVASAAARGVG
jgi:hypothetical protein